MSIGGDYSAIIPVSDNAVSQDLARHSAGDRVAHTFMARLGSLFLFILVAFGISWSTSLNLHGGNSESLFYAGM
jgi:hypothetical protein